MDEERRDGESDVLVAVESGLGGCKQEGDRVRLGGG